MVERNCCLSQDHEYLITTDMSLYTQVPAKTLLSIYEVYPQGYQHSLLDKELISLLLSSIEKYHFFEIRISPNSTINSCWFGLFTENSTEKMMVGITENQKAMLIDPKVLVKSIRQFQH